MWSTGVRTPSVNPTWSMARTLGAPGSGAAGLWRASWVISARLVVGRAVSRTSEGATNSRPRAGAVPSSRGRSDRRVDARHRPGLGHRIGRKGCSSYGTFPVTIASASRRPVSGPSTMPHMPCPPAANTRGELVGPTRGSPSGVHGREPTHSSWRSSRSTPRRTASRRSRSPARAAGRGARRGRGTPSCRRSAAAPPAVCRRHAGPAGIPARRAAVRRRR